MASKSSMKQMRRGPIFGPLEQPRAHEYVAEQIRRQIFLGAATVGEALPPERQLAEMFGVGRATIQAALEILERDRLVDRRVGRNGGTFVRTEVDGRGSMARVLSRIKKDQVRIDSVLRFRELVEPAAASDAARDRSEAELSFMSEAHDRGLEAESNEESLRSDAEFHLAIARASHNQFFLQSSEQIRVVLRDVLVALPESELWMDRSNREHARILAAIKAGDVSEARRSMLRHIAHTAKSAKALIRAI